MPKLNDLTIAILTEEGFEQVELTSPREALEKAGVTVHIISPQKDEVKAWNETDWGIRVRVDKPLNEASPEDYDCLMLPGGVLNPDKLRLNEEAVEFVKHFLETGKPIAAICHGPQTMIETGLLEGRRMTSYPSIKSDLINAGVEWVDEEVVTDHGLVTSRSPKDLPAFNKKMLEEFAEGVHEVAK
jgi:protease I